VLIKYEHLASKEIPECFTVCVPACSIPHLHNELSEWIYRHKEHCVE